jgi:hypothetical protein
MIEMFMRAWGFRFWHVKYDAPEIYLDKGAKAQCGELFEQHSQ